MESRKMVLMKLFSGQQWRHRHREQTYGHGVGEEGEGEMYGESNMESYIAICKIDSQWEFAEWGWELKPVLCDNVEGWVDFPDSSAGEESAWNAGDLC